MKKFLVLAMLCVSCFSFTACGSSIGTSHRNVDTWNIPDSSRFVPVDKYSIYDGTTNGMDFVTFVDLENGTMWLYTEKFQSGYGTTFTKLTDEYNNACVYEQLNELRDKYNYRED